MLYIAHTNSKDVCIRKYYCTAEPPKQDLPDLRGRHGQAVKILLPVGHTVFPRLQSAGEKICSVKYGIFCCCLFCLPAPQVRKIVLGCQSVWACRVEASCEAWSVAKIFKISFRISYLIYLQGGIMKKAHYHQRQGRFFYPNYQRTNTTNRKKFCGLLSAGFFIFMMVFGASSVVLARAT